MFDIVAVSPGRRPLLMEYSDMLRRLTTLYSRCLNEEPAECASLLEIECGSGSPAVTPRPHPPTIVDMDTITPVIDKSYTTGANGEHIRADARGIDLMFCPQWMDCDLVLDLIEYLQEADGCELIRQREMVSLRGGLIYNTVGYLSRDLKHCNSFKHHRSGMFDGLIQPLRCGSSA